MQPWDSTARMEQPSSAGCSRARCASEVTVAQAASLGLTEDEYQRIVDTLQREPTAAELAMYGAMWSEHCSYKSSKIYLKTLPTEGPRVVMGPGESAGSIDIGDGLVAVFKLQSHN